MMRSFLSVAVGVPFLVFLYCEISKVLNGRNGAQRFRRFFQPLVLRRPRLRNTVYQRGQRQHMRVAKRTVSRIVPHRSAIRIGAQVQVANVRKNDFASLYGHNDASFGGEQRIAMSMAAWAGSMLRRIALATGRGTPPKVRIQSSASSISAASALSASWSSCASSTALALTHCGSPCWSM